MLWDRIPTNERKTLQMSRVDVMNTCIAEWDIEDAVKARYKADIETLQKYYTLHDGNERDVIQKIRPVLEGYCRNLNPSQFSEEDTLGVMIGKIRDAGVSHSLFEIHDKLDELNDYCRRYHHAENNNTATETVDDNELKGYTASTLNLVGCLY